MRLTTIAVFALMFALVTASFAADINGTWKGQRPGRDGNMMDVTFTFKPSGDAFTGTMSGMGDRQFEIKDGKISGDDISFTMTLEFGGNSMKFNYSGKVSGNEIKMKSQREGGDRVTEFTVKRS